GTLGERFAVLDDNRIGSDLDALRIEPGLPVAHVELPSMPGAAEQFAHPRALIDAGLWRSQARDASRLVQRRAGVRAAIEKREKLAVDVEHDDVAAIERDHLVAAGRNFRGGGDNVTGHVTPNCFDPMTLPPFPLPTGVVDLLLAMPTGRATARPMTGSASSNANRVR